jgi:hypothetical protein
MKNYYQCLQIAHIINQLVQASQEIRGLIKARLKCTVKYLWKRLMSYMLEVLVDRTELLILTQNVLLRKSGKHQLIKRYAYTKKTNLRA